MKRDRGIYWNPADPVDFIEHKPGETRMGVTESERKAAEAMFDEWKRARKKRRSRSPVNGGPRKGHVPPPKPR